MNFKLYLPLLCTFIFLLQSCDNNDAYFPGDGSDLETYESLEVILNPDTTPSDSIVFIRTEDTFINGNYVDITIPANTVTGNAGRDTLLLVLKEFPTLERMFWGNVQTTSDDHHLVTGGNFWWKVTDLEGNDYAVPNPSPVTAQMSLAINMGAYGDSAQYFKGQTITAGGQEIINWSLVDNNSGMGQGDNQGFYIEGLEIGWANCDAFLSYEDRTQFKVKLSSGGSLNQNETIVALLPSDYPSLINIYDRDGEYLVAKENSIPMGLSGTLIGVALDNSGHLFIGSLAIDVAGDDEYEISMAPANIDDLRNLVNQAANN